MALTKQELAHAYMQLWNAGGVMTLEEYADPGLEVDYTHFGDTYKGIAEYTEMLHKTYEYFPDLRIDIQNIIVSDDTATVQWQYTGTHQSGNLFGKEPTGKQVTVPGITILWFKGDKVIRESGIVDNLSLVMQLGVL